MARFGVTPYGDPLYRIVFAASRRSLIFGEWPDGRTEARYEPRYAELHNVWILERWLPAAEYAGCDRETWDRTLSILGPYPERGEYELAHVFEACGPVDANLEKLISWIEESRKRSYWENRTALKEHYEQEQKGVRSVQDAMIRNRLSAFLDAPMSGYKGGRGSKTRPIVKTAEELGLPAGNNKFVSLKGKHHGKPAHLTQSHR